MTTSYAGAKSPSSGNSSHRPAAGATEADITSQPGFDGQVEPPAKDVIDAGIGVSRPVGDTGLRTHDRWLAIKQVIDAEPGAELLRELEARGQIEQVVLPGRQDGGVGL